MSQDILIRKIKKVYSKEKEKIPALEDISLTITKNEFVSVVGMTGCGKTTLLKIVGGLLEPSEGDVLIGNEIPSIALRKHKLGFIFQESSLLPWRSCYSNIKLASEIIGDHRADEKMINDVMSMAGLVRAKNLLPAELSGGMRACVSIARTFSINPSVLLMDEPFSHLDEITRQNMNELLLDFCSGKDITSVLVTHNISDAVFLSDRVVVLSRPPALIKKIIPINLSRPRRNEIRFEPSFARYEKEIFDQLLDSRQI